MSKNSTLIVLFNGYEEKIIKSSKFLALTKNLIVADIIGFPDTTVPFTNKNNIEKKFNITLKQVEFDENFNTYSKSSSRANIDFKNDYKKFKSFHNIIDFDWFKMISNDRVFYRVMPIFDFEEKIRIYLKQNKIQN